MVLSRLRVLEYYRDRSASAPAVVYMLISSHEVAETVLGKLDAMVKNGGGRVRLKLEVSEIVDNAEGVIARVQRLRERNNLRRLPAPHRRASGSEAADVDED